MLPLMGNLGVAVGIDQVLCTRMRRDESHATQLLIGNDCYSRKRMRVLTLHY